MNSSPEKRVHPLNAIVGLAECAIENSNRQNYRESMDLIAWETNRCGSIIHGILQFTRDQRTEKARHDLNSEVLHSLDLLKTYIPGGVQLESRLHGGPLMVLMNTTKMEQVIINIVRNVLDAAADVAKVAITTGNIDSEAVLSITDNGPGIPAEIADKIFDPFLSTRAAKKRGRPDSASASVIGLSRSIPEPLR